MPPDVKIVHTYEPLDAATETIYKQISAAASFDELAPLFRCGFEFETTSSFNHTHAELTREHQQWATVGSIDRKAAWEKLKSARLAALPGAVIAKLVREPWSIPQVWDCLNSTQRTALLKSYKDEATTLTHYTDHTLLDDPATLTQLVNHGITLPRVPDYENISVAQWLARRAGLPYEQIHGGTDSSVPGVEWRTNGGLEVPTFLELASKLFAHPHAVHEGCSFHIHLSVPGIEAQYGQPIQQAMCEFLLSQADKIPERVKQRWRNTEVRRFFRPILTADKHVMVSHSATHHTWEFRCWGNIQSIDDARACLYLSMLAYQHQVKLRLGKGTFTLDSTNFQDTLPEIRAAMGEGKPLQLKDQAAPAEEEC